jgi:hypothetical protein
MHITKVKFEIIFKDNINCTLPTMHRAVGRYYTRKRMLMFLMGFLALTATSMAQKQNVSIATKQTTLNKNK